MSSDSGYKVPLTTITEILPHFNAHSLQIAKGYGFEVIIGKDSYKVGDQVLYIPIDSVIPVKLEDELFPEGSKIKLNKHRVRQIKIRSAFSQGMLVNPESIKKVYGFLPTDLETDYAEEVEIKKYEPPVKGSPQGTQSTKIKAKKNSHFREYKGVGNIKWFPSKFKEGEIVFAQEKLHGTNAGVSLTKVKPVARRVDSTARLTA